MPLVPEVPTEQLCKMARELEDVSPEKPRAAAFACWSWSVALFSQNLSRECRRAHRPSSGSLWLVGQ